MTLEQFVILRRDELIEFFKVRYGFYWRRRVARHAQIHPRSFERFLTAPPLSLYRVLTRLEKWARSIGFTSKLDQEVQEAIRAHDAFTQEAANEIAQAEGKRNSGVSAGDEYDLSKIYAQLEAGMSAHE